MMPSVSGRYRLPDGRNELVREDRGRAVPHCPVRHAIMNL